MKGREGSKELVEELGLEPTPQGTPGLKWPFRAAPHWGLHIPIRHRMEAVPAGAVALGGVAVSWCVLKGLTAAPATMVISPVLSQGNLASVSQHPPADTDIINLLALSPFWPFVYLWSLNSHVTFNYWLIFLLLPPFKFISPSEHGPALRLNYGIQPTDPP